MIEALLLTLTNLFDIARIIIILIVFQRVFVGFPAKFEEKDKQIKALHKRVNELENPDEEKSSPVFRDEPDWLR
jgi:hypothetical protein